MDILYAPWREDYASTIGRDPKGKETTSSEECIFCTIAQSAQDEENLVIKRYESCFVILNRYPYNAGHLLIIPYKHHKALSDCEKQEQEEMLEVIVLSGKKLAEAVNYDGLNIGLNIGKAAGAGIPSHIHWHVLPRWLGDTNFLPTLAHTKIISVDLQTLYKKLKPLF